MPDNIDVWLKRANEVLAKGHTSSQTVPFAASILVGLYGPNSAQLAAFNNRMQEASRLKQGASFEQLKIAYGTIQNLAAEIENGLIVNLRAQVSRRSPVGTRRTRQRNTLRQYGSIQKRRGSVDCCRV